MAGVAHGLFISPICLHSLGLWDLGGWPALVSRPKGTRSKQPELPGALGARHSPLSPLASYPQVLNTGPPSLFSEVNEDLLRFGLGQRQKE